MRSQIVTAEPCHIPYIAADVRQADRDELYAIACYSPSAALTVSLSVSTKAWTGLINAYPVCMMGVAGGSVLSETGRPWLIGTEHLDKHTVTVLRRCKGMVGKMLELYPRLENYIDVRNVRAVQWLSWLGFKFDQPEPYGVMQLPFMRFSMER